MKIIFLDFDGVLNTFNGESLLRDDGVFSKAACNNLNKLLNSDSKLKIVVSSSWRQEGLDSVKRILKSNGIDGTKVVDITGEERGSRGHQVQCWINRNPGVTSFVVLDDEDNFPNMADRLVRTNPFVGLTKANVEKALDILKKTC